MPVGTHAGNFASHDDITLLAANSSNRAQGGAQRQPLACHLWPVTLRQFRAGATTQDVFSGMQLGKPSTSMPNSARRRIRVFV